MINEPIANKWRSPRHWLSDNIEELAANNDVAALRELCQQLCLIAENDSIQIAFYKELDAEGYFKREELPSQNFGELNLGRSRKK